MHGILPDGERNKKTTGTPTCDWWQSSPRRQWSSLSANGECSALQESIMRLLLQLFHTHTAGIIARSFIGCILVWWLDLKQNEPPSIRDDGLFLFAEVQRFSRNYGPVVGAHLDHSWSANNCQSSCGGKRGQQRYPKTDVTESNGWQATSGGGLPLCPVCAILGPQDIAWNI